MSEFEPMIPKLLSMKEDFDLNSKLIDRGYTDYKTIKDELYL